jgi:condensin complex subunit 1
MGIRRMLRLIWTKSNNDEGKAVQTHLIETYKELFFVAPDRFTENESANFIARNMISLTFGTSAAELSCLEQLVSKMMAESLVPENVIQKLWQIYGVQKREISKSQRRGAIIVLGMLGLAKPDILIAELDTILRVGLGPLGRSDLGLARYTCLALRHISPNTRKTNGNTNFFLKFRSQLNLFHIEKRGLKGKLPNDHTVLTRLAGLVELETDSKDW